MTAAASAATGEDAAKTTAFEAEARALAEAQRDLHRAESAVAHFPDLSPSPIARALERARKHFASSQFADATMQQHCF